MYMYSLVKNISQNRTEAPGRIARCKSHRLRMGTLVSMHLPEPSSVNANPFTNQRMCLISILSPLIL